MAESAPAWLHGDRLHRVWDLIGDALERRSLEPRGTCEVRELSREERHALSDLLGTPVTGASVRLRLADLDERLRARTGRGACEVVTWVTGRGLVDRAARRRLASARREEPFEAARDWLSRSSINVRPSGTGTSPEPVTEGWVDDWLGGMRRDGVLTAEVSGTAVLVTALQILEARGALAGEKRGVIARTDLAAQTTGSAHGLDDGTKVSLVVLRAAAARAGVPLPRTALDRRRLWESLGVVADRVSATCLTWNVVPGTAATGPRHLTWWDLGAGPLPLGPRLVLICENPRTLEAIAELGSAAERVGIVCTMGQANLVVREVLRRLVSAGAVLRYHGDFDWAGVALANACLAEFGAEPWLMAGDDYQSGHGSEPLSGRSVEAGWDAELAAAMRARGVAVHEEAVLGELVRRLPELWA